MNKRTSRISAHGRLIEHTQQHLLVISLLENALLTHIDMCIHKRMRLRVILKRKLESPKFKNAGAAPNLPNAAPKSVSVKNDFCY